MKLTEDKLKEILQRQTARSTPRQTECLTEERFIRAATGEMSPDERRDVARHLITCTDCAEEYQTILSLKPWAAEAEATPGHEAPTLRTFRSKEKTAVTRIGRSWPGTLRDSVSTFWQQLIWEPRARPAIAVAITVVVVAAAVVVWQSTRRDGPPQSTERARVSFKLTVEPANKAALSAVPEKLTWTAVPQALTYRVVLYDFQSTPIWESARHRETSVTLPDAVRRNLLPNQTYYWRVIAEDAIEQRQSELFQFTLTADVQR